ncbi:MAG: hypothetical protein G01um10145_326 [Microgenomates group bacterium Gr01-1014_5]|nr:MAG: hypothetical protein G01um10145_326 [Microgenomates group bacterium Gr01-1014_5]
MERSPVSRLSCQALLQQLLEQSRSLPPFAELQQARDNIEPRQFFPSGPGGPVFEYPGCMIDPGFLGWTRGLDEASHQRLLDQIVELEMEIIGVSEEVREIVRKDGEIMSATGSFPPLPHTNRY